MNKANLKSYAPQARKDFIEAVTARAHLLGLAELGGKLEVEPAQNQGTVTVIAGQAWPSKVNGQRDKLIERIEKDGFAQTMEAIAYTWFNRFAALRYMEVHDFLSHGYRALSSSSGTDGALPDLLTHATDIAQNGSLPGLKANEVLDLKLAGNRDGDLYRMMLVAQCNALSNAMPFMFERIDDETELLLPDNLLRTDSIIAKLVNAIPEEDWKEIEVIGWLYQFYISEKKDQVIGKVVKSEDIPAATQLFTPNWIVQYLVQNSVGRLWLMANPSSTLASEWPYYIQPAEQTPEVQAQLDALIQVRMDEDGGTLNPETITVLDPACGSGHILVVAYDVLKAIYLERGYRLRDIPRLILEKNLYGLDIDDRAAQMAGFALLMKARADDRRLFTTTDENGNPVPPKLNVLSLQDSKGLDANALYADLAAFVAPAAQQDSGFGKNDLFPETRPQMTLGEVAAPATANKTSGISLQDIADLISTFEHAKTFGSLIQISPQLLPALRHQLFILNHAAKKADWVGKAAANDLLPLVQQALVLGMQFDAVTANPPYMGNKFYCPVLKEYVNIFFEKGKADLYTAFTLQNIFQVKSGGYIGMITIPNWMFLSSFVDFRDEILINSPIHSLIHIGRGVWGSDFGSCSYVLQRSSPISLRGNFLRLFENQGSVATNEELEARFHTNARFVTSNADFEAIPGSPVAYWIKNTKPFNGPKIQDEFESGGRTKTHNNDKYLRYWWEVSNKSETWEPYANGGDFRKYAGNDQYVINWSSFARTNYESHGGLYNPKFWGKEGITWGLITVARSSFRVKPNRHHYSSGAPTIFNKNFNCDPVVLSFLNSPIAHHYLKAINPTVNTTVNDVLGLPLPKRVDFPIIDDNTSTLISLSTADWNSYERSWNFLGSPLLINSIELKTELKFCFADWVEQNRNATALMKRLEEENNRLLIGAYSMADELKPIVPLSQITLTANPNYRYGDDLAETDQHIRFRQDSMSELISYAIGCMMGRYSLDESGLIYAHEGNIGLDISRYQTFPADADGILPMTDEHWFADDAPERVREFLEAVWGPDTLEENMAWLAESLGTKGSETPAETIRRYMADKFYKDHLQTYKKRPIYWLFSSGKQGAFQALVYLHRYNENTLARMRAEYVVPLTGKMQARIEMLQKDALAAPSTAARNKLNKEVEKLHKKHAELLAYDEKLRHYADMRIKLDLDDGVKVNYGKFGDLLDSVKVITGGSSDD